MTLSIMSVHEGQDMDIFWKLFDRYIRELAGDANKGDGIDLAYYNSQEYRQAIHRILDRDRNPIRIHFIRNDKEIIGFSMYQILFDDSRSACLMEFFIDKAQRRRGLGQNVYQSIEEVLREEGVESVELTPTNDRNTGFWSRLGYEVTNLLDEDHKPIYRKII